jgi:hypothetical protein
MPSAAVGGTRDKRRRRKTAFRFPSGTAPVMLELTSPKYIACVQEVADRRAGRQFTSMFHVAGYRLSILSSKIGTVRTDVRANAPVGAGPASPTSDKHAALKLKLAPPVSSRLAVVLSVAVDCPRPLVALPPTVAHIALHTIHSFWISTVDAGRTRRIFGPDECDQLELNLTSTMLRSATNTSPKRAESGKITSSLWSAELTAMRTGDVEGHASLALGSSMFAGDTVTVRHHICFRVRYAFASTNAHRLRRQWFTRACSSTVARAVAVFVRSAGLQSCDRLYCSSQVGDYELQLIDRHGGQCQFGESAAEGAEPGFPTRGSDLIRSEYPLLVLHCNIKLTRVSVEQATDAMWDQLFED